jgi:ABC-type bacteriocin/lantibiotic exporter with double-glycine peptidase domain
MVRLVLINNNEEFNGDINFVNLITPITRIASISFMVINDLITYVLPILLFLTVIICYFFYNDPLIGCLFLVGNGLIFFYLSMVWNEIMKKNEDYEKSAADNENYILEVLNNMDKIVYRGQTEEEIKNLNNLSDNTIKNAYSFYSMTNNNTMFMNLIVYFIIFTFLYYNIHKVLNKKLSVVVFITYFTIILLYREKMASIIQQIQDFGEFFGRINGVISSFDDIKHSIDTNYGNHNVEFNTIVFENVTFKYPKGKQNIFTNLNLTIHLNDKIIGVTGSSGRGKSTFMKLVLRMYNKYTGNIYIDGVNVKDLDPDYIRQNITYVNQNSKLFDKIVFENMMYGCNHDETCKKNLEYILNNYKKINELFQNIDIYNKKAGSLGENLSGGQRQVVNIIGGLINPSKILLLDEPTNALDKDLKTDILELIADFKQHKKCIMIITHDKDVHGLFDQHIQM